MYVTMSDNILCSLEIATLLWMTYGVHKTGRAAGAQDGTLNMRHMPEK